MYRESRGLFAVVLVLTLGALAYGGAYFVRAASSDIRAHTVHTAVLRDTVPLRGVVIREECVLYPDSPLVCPAAAEGERVGRGALLALVCPQEECLPAAEAALAGRSARMLLRPLRPETERAGSGSALEKAAELLTGKSSAALARGELLRAGAYLRPLGAFLRGEETDGISVPESAAYSPVLSAQSGLFSETTDSLEALTPDAPGTAEELRRILAQGAPGGVPGAFGRLCTGSTWYLAVPLAADSLIRFSPGDTVTLELDPLTVQARVSAVTAEKDGGVVLFSVREGLSEILSLRCTGGEAVLGEQTGLLVPEEAVFAEGEEFFVYRTAGRIVKKTAVSVLAHTDGAFLLTASQLRSGAVLLSGRSLSDGMLLTPRDRTDFFCFTSVS